MVNLRLTQLDKGTYIKIQPHKTDFIKLPDPKTMLIHKKPRKQPEQFHLREQK